jgi:hypothetical protein
MIKVYQTIVDKGRGNCMQAVVASLLELPLDDVPHFLIKKNLGSYGMYKFFREWGFDPCYINKEKYDTEFMCKIAKFDGGVDGYFYGVVKSQTFEGISHAVIVDENLNIIHDPNPNQSAMKLSPDDVKGIYVMHDMVIGKTGKLFTNEEWNATTEAERDENTHKHTSE